MKRSLFCIVFILCAQLSTPAQTEYYSDAFLGFPEFRVLPLRMPTQDPDSVRMDIHVRVVNDDLQFIKKNDSYLANYGVDISVRSEDDDLVGSKHADRQLVAYSYSQTNSRTEGDQTQFTFTLPPTFYSLRVDLTDKETRKHRTLETDMDFTGWSWEGKIRLGDIALVDSSGGVVMTSAVPQGELLRSAFVVYCEDIKELELFYQLRNDKDDVEQSASLRLRGEGPFYVDTLSVETDSLRASRYQFLLVAKYNGKTLMRNYPFDLRMQNLPVYISNLNMAITQLKYIASDDEYRQLTKSEGARREKLFQQFWEKRDPTPSTITNERMDEYYRRVEYANEHFSGYRGGWESDMGHVYIVYGPPTDVERRPFNIDRKPYEVWYYYDINRKFIFQDQEGFGDYRLISSFWEEY